MGRPPKLDERQKADILKRLTAGESMGKVAKDFKVSKALLSSMFSERLPDVQKLVTTIAVAEAELERLPISEQRSLRPLIDQMKGIQTASLNAALNHARISERVSELAIKKLDLVEEEGVLLNTEKSQEDLKQVARLTALSNESMRVPIGIAQANKAKADPGQTLENLITGETA